MAGYADGLRNAQLDAKTTFINSAALLRWYDTPRPSRGAAITTQVKLAEFTLGSPYSSAASGGVLAPTLPANVNGLATGVAAWYRIVKADGTTFCEDGAIGTSGSGAEVIVNTTQVSSGVGVSVTSMSVTAGNTA